MMILSRGLPNYKQPVMCLLRGMPNYEQRMIKYGGTRQPEMTTLIHGLLNYKQPAISLLRGLPNYKLPVMSLPRGLTNYEQLMNRSSDSTQPWNLERRLFQFINRGLPFSHRV